MEKVPAAVCSWRGPMSSCAAMQTDDVGRGRQIWLRIAGAVVLAVVAGMYLHSLSRSRLPPGHPWSGLTLTLCAAQLFVLPRRTPTLVLAALALVSASVWFFAAH